jgi:hypothetical protein
MQEILETPGLIVAGNLEHGRVKVVPFIRLDRHSGTLYGNPFTGQSKVTTLEPIVSGSMVLLIGKYKKDLSCNLLQFSLASDQKEKGGRKKKHK